MEGKPADLTPGTANGFILRKTSELKMHGITNHFKDDPTVSLG
jgi:hypothetical protein